VADRFSIMEKGRLVASGLMDHLDDELVSTHLSV
jgi:ABC-type branched-subunit amino acid transport system ATPase component